MLKFFIVKKELMISMDFLKEIVKEIGDDFTKVAQDIDETERFIDTGSHIFNAVVSGSIYGGVSSNKITAIAGESSTGKTYFSLAVVKNFLDNNPDGPYKKILRDKGITI